MNVPFLSLKTINETYNDRLKEVLNDFLERGSYMLSDNVQKFEEDFARFCDAEHCIGVANGLDALELILSSLDLPAGSEVLVPANTYFASVLSIINAGLRPILIEPNPSTYLIDNQTIEKHISHKTKAMLAVNLYGKMCDFESLSSLTKKHRIKLIVDAAQSHGAVLNDTKDCKGADAIAYSFYPTKNLGALTDAGAVVTNNSKLAERIKACRNYGSKIKYQFDYLGKNSRLSELQAGFLLVKLNYLNDEIAIRRKIAKRYLTEINNPKIILPPSDSIEQDAWHLFVIRTKDREDLKKHLKENGIGFDIHYPIPPHKQKAFKELNHLSLPITEEIHRTILSIPLNVNLKEDEINYIIKTLNTF